MDEVAPEVPEILRTGTRGVRVKIWTFLYLNEPRWFTAQQIAEYLKMPLSTVQVALKDLRSLAPRIQCQDIDREGKGRPEKEYSFQKILQK
jgi:predicted transcriptional regulator